MYLVYCRTGSESQQPGLSEHGRGRCSPGLLAADRALPRTVRTVGRRHWVRIELHEDFQYGRKGAGAQAWGPHTSAHRLLFDEHSYHSENNLSNESEYGKIFVLFEIVYTYLMRNLWWLFPSYSSVVLYSMARASGTERGKSVAMLNCRPTALNTQ